MIKKLRQIQGETLIETLVSLLIAVLSVLLLSTAVLASSKINQQTREMDEKYQSQLQEAEGLEENAAKENVMLTITFGAVEGETVYESKTVEVTLYGSEESQFLSYDYASEEEQP